MSKESIDKKLNVLLRDYDREKLRLMYLNSDDNFYKFVELYIFGNPPIKPALFLEALCETCGINPNQTLPEDYQKAKQTNEIQKAELKGVIQERIHATTDKHPHKNRSIESDVLLRDSMPRTRNGSRS